MEANYKPYVYLDSDARIQEILDSAETFEEVNDIPSRDKLTYSNGFYVNCTALFIDIRGSSGLPQTHTRPVLGKLYRSYLSECVAVMNGAPQCREIFINGDCVSGIFNTPYKSDVDAVFGVSAQLNSVTQILNWRLAQKDYETYACGIGMAYGRALMLKAGYKGSGINDVIWMGDVVNEASNLCHEGNRGSNDVIQVSPLVHSNLKDEYKGFLKAAVGWPSLEIERYQGNVIDRAMDAYLTELKKKAAERSYIGQLAAAFLQPKKSIWG